MATTLTRCYRHYTVFTVTESVLRICVVTNSSPRFCSIIRHMHILDLPVISESITILPLYVMHNNHNPTKQTQNLNVTHSIALRSMSTSSPVQSGIFFFLLRRLLEWQVMSAFATVPSTCNVCLKVPSSS